MSDTITATPTPAAPAPLQDKFIQLISTLNGEMVERTKETQTGVIALIGGVHHFQLGSPGTAKSRLVRTMKAHIGGIGTGEYFERLVTRFSTPEELFGPPSLTALENDEYLRNIKGMLPEAKLAFVDEIFKANSSILNSLLTIMNERIFYNGGPISVPLSTLFCASNELPQGEELEAMYDRVHFRHVVKPIQEAGNFIQMLKLQIAGAPQEIVTWDEVTQAKIEAEAVTVPDDVLDAMNTLRNNLRKEGIEPTDRRMAECLKIIRATAWMSQRPTADIDDMRLLRHVLWTRPDEQATVEKAVLELANPLDKEAMDLLETVEKLAVDLDEVIKNSDNKQIKNKKGIELHGKLERAKADLDGLEKRASKTGRKSDTMNELNTRLLGVTRTLLKEIFGIDASQVPGT